MEIEKLSNGRWQSTVREKSEIPEIMISLEPGLYRYRIDVIDLLGRKRPSAEWSRLTVLRALQPELTSFSPQTHPLDSADDLVVMFKGAAIEPNARIDLISAAGIQIESDTVTIDENKKAGKAVFKKERLSAGYWSLRVQNPGGLETSLPTLAINARLPSEVKPAGKEHGRFMVSESYAFMAPLHGSFTGFFLAPYYPLGVRAGFAVFPFKGMAAPFGFEVQPAWTYMESSGVYYDTDYLVSGHLLEMSLHAVFHTRFLNGHLGLNVRAGGGVAMLYNLRVQQADTQEQWIISVDSISGFIPTASLSVGLSFIFNNLFFIELGLNYHILLSRDNPFPMYLTPLLSFGLFF